MNISPEKLTNLRTDRGWSQEKLAAISGVSERTIQRAERDGVCSLDTKLAFATAFEVSPSELAAEQDEVQGINTEIKTNWGGVFGLFVLGLVAPIIVLLTATNVRWEIASLVLVWGLTIVLTTMNCGIKSTYALFDNTSWIVRYPTYVKGLNKYILQAKTTIESAYIVGAVSTLVAGLAIAVHVPAEFEEFGNYFAIVSRPLIYSVLFVELWFRPYKKKMESMLLEQQDRARSKSTT